LTFDPVRVLAGFLLSVVIAGVAYQTRSLSRSGAAAAIIVATLCTAAGWSWAWLLIIFFVTSTALSRLGESRKQGTLHDVADKGNARDAWQVAANGGVFAIFAVVSLGTHSTLIYAAAAGALAASTADTWATEIGALSRAMPRSILSMKVVPPGTSGGVTLMGLLASAAGAFFISITAVLLGWPRVVICAALTGGITASVIDSLLGASFQGRRWCEQCGRGTERAVHTCGTKTIHAGGKRWLDNDMVNLVSSASGALVGTICLI
jgi:uncharacterized protein (TIGR00297 family)